jgi:hypothetical protein
VDSVEHDGANVRRLRRTHAGQILDTCWSPHGQVLVAADIIGAVASSPNPAAAPSFGELRSRLIPTTSEERWDDGELPRAILHLHDHAALEGCELLLRLVCVQRRCLDEAGASRTVALREVLLELLRDGLDHPCCEVLRVLAGLEPGTAGRSREARQRIAGDRLGTPRFPSAPRTVRRRTKAECWPWGLATPRGTRL